MVPKFAPFFFTKPSQKPSNLLEPRKKSKIKNFIHSSMAAKDEALKSNKRKRIAGDKAPKSTDELKKKSKTLPIKKGQKISSKDDNQKKEIKQQKLSKHVLSKPKSLQKTHEVTTKDDKSKKEMRQLAKERVEVRKKRRKPHYTLEQELSLLWEKMRRRNIAKEERSKFVTEALQKMKGKIPEIASSHISSRVLQTCVKYCSDAERGAVYGELEPHLLPLSLSTYAVHLVTKMFDNASKSQLSKLISLLHGNVARLLRHSVGSIVVEHAYQMANAMQRRELLMELYSKELELFKGLANMKETRIVDIISKLELSKATVCRHMTNVLQSIWEKGIVDHSIVHKALIEYFSIADKMSAEEVIKQLSGPLLVRIIHTKDGSRIGMLCVKHGGAKERKKLLKAMKEHMGKIIRDSCGTLVLVSILSTVDDTKLVSKILIRELQSNLKEIILDKSSRRPVLQLLHPYCQRYISLEDLADLNASIPALCSKAGKESNEDEDMPLAKSADKDFEELADPEDTELPPWEAEESTEPGDDTSLAEGGKKDPLVRRQELLVKSGLAESLVDVCIESADKLLKSNFGKDVLYEVAVGGADGILRPTLDDKLTSLYEKIADLASEPKADESEHILENFHSSRTIRKLVLDCPSFASILWTKALQGKCKTWAHGHSSKIVAAFVESTDSNIQDLTKKELQPLVDDGVLKIPVAKPTDK
ncbi:hypothetical protein RND81_12G137200 [Saponaria officinalis]|uniref:PUM-HD domain-containing protein n=1 Tax=Saponaria officinalis TaxID=3572 RepID=A0AAW1HA87_SAPOF